MFLANVATLALPNLHTVAAYMFQEASVGWDPISLWKQMVWLARIVVIILFIMSGWSIGVMIDRAMAFSAARKQSRAFAPAVAGALREGKIEEAIKVAERNKKSHLAKVVTAGLQEFKAHGDSTEIPGEQILLDENVEAEGHEFFSLGAASVSLDGNTLAFSVDVVGDERYTIRLRNLGISDAAASTPCRRSRPGIRLCSPNFVIGAA